MSLGRQRVGAVIASLATAAALAGATAAAAGPRVEKAKLTADIGYPERVIAYGSSRLLLFGRGPTITRINKNGSLDRSFGDGGRIEITSFPGADKYSYPGVTVAPDAKILVTIGGSTPGQAFDNDAQVTRLLPNGQPDPSFGGDGTVEVDLGGRLDRGQEAAVAANGEILVGGTRQTVASSRGGNDATPAVTRLLPNGALDRSFGNDGVIVLRGGWEGGIFDLAPTLNGGIVVEGEAYIGTAVWKLTASGSMDRSFGKRGEVVFEGRGKRTQYGWQEELSIADQMVVLPSGKILLGGTGDLTGFPYDTPGQYRAVAVRLRPDGRVDRTFGKRGWAVAKIAGSTFVHGLTMLPGGVLLLAADSQNHHDKRSDVGAIAFGPDGRPDPRFGRRGRLRVNLAGWDLIEGVTALDGRAVILGIAGKDNSRWLVTCPPPVGRWFAARAG